MSALFELKSCVNPSQKYYLKTKFPNLALHAQTIMFMYPDFSGSEGLTYNNYDIIFHVNSTFAL